MLIRILWLIYTAVRNQRNVQFVIFTLKYDCVARFIYYVNKNIELSWAESLSMIPININDICMVCKR